VTFKPSYSTLKNNSLIQTQRRKRKLQTLRITLPKIQVLVFFFSFDNVNRYCIMLFIYFNVCRITF